MTDEQTFPENPSGVPYSTGTSGRWNVTTITRTPAAGESQARSAPAGDRSAPQAPGARRYRWLVVPLVAALAVAALVGILVRRGVAG